MSEEAPGRGFARIVPALRDVFILLAFMLFIPDCPHGFIERTTVGIAALYLIFLLFSYPFLAGVALVEPHADVQVKRARWTRLLASVALWAMFLGFIATSDSNHYSNFYGCT